MRRISALLVPLFVVLLQATAYAGMHWGGWHSGTHPGPGQVLLGVLALLIVIAVLAWFIKQFLGAGTTCAIFVAVGSVATMIIVVEYVFVILFQDFAYPGLWHMVVVAILNIIVLAAMVLWADQCCLHKNASLIVALKVVVIPAILAVLLSWKGL